jgi:5'-phosphate synthase pdxT subunit
LVIEKLGYNASEVRTVNQLHGSDALIIPGGESSTLLKMINRFGLFTELQKYAQKHPIMGTCAGLIILAQSADRLDSPPLGLIDITVQRNAYGRQRDSFIDNIKLSWNGKVHEYEGVFIRAPKILSFGPDVTPLAFHGSNVVMAASKNILVCSFHPELTQNSSIHKYFLTKFL